eukprot:3282002-Rhodomonas_salina.2
MSANTSLKPRCARAGCATTALLLAGSVSTIGEDTTSTGRETVSSHAASATGDCCDILGPGLVDTRDVVLNAALHQVFLA